MHAQRSSVAEEQDRHDYAVLGLLIGSDAQRPLAVEEVAREIGEEVAAIDALGRLCGAGLVHRLGGFVFAARAAVRAADLAQ